MKKRLAALAVVCATIPSLTFADHPPTEAVSIDEPCSISENLTVGSRGAHVHCLQEALIDAGLLRLSEPTGFYGPATKKAVALWQEHHGVSATGYFGALSRAAWSTKTIATAAHSTATSSAEHMPIDATGWASRPDVAIKIFPDAMSGYNLEILPNNFVFAPEHVNGPVIPNEGHAHLYVNGAKLARVYGPWFHIGADKLVKGSNDIRVSLNANDHSELAVQGIRVAATSTIIIN